jgi:hypothetical protein
VKQAALVLVALVALLGRAAEVHADEAEGKRHWKLGQELYAQKKFLDAAREFEAGYAVAPRPLFLMNIGHAYRRANELAKAKNAYEALLRLQPDLPQRKEVEAYIKAIDDALQAAEMATLDQGARPAPPPPSPVTPPPATSPPVAVAPPPTVPVYVEARDTPPESAAEGHSSIFRKPWFWVITGAVVAGAVATGVIVSRPRRSCEFTLCIHEPPPP